jgi:hypothetical protein
LQLGASGGLQPQFQHGQVTAAVTAHALDELVHQRGHQLAGGLRLHGVAQRGRVRGHAFAGALHDLAQQFGAVGEVVGRRAVGDARRGVDGAQRQPTRALAGEDLDGGVEQGRTAFRVLSHGDLQEAH